MMTPRRALLTALGGMLAAPGILSGCSSNVLGGRKQTTVRFWNGFTGPDGRTMLGLVRKFNAENPDIHVVMQRMDWGTFYNKLFVAGLGGRA
ncbi:MAG: ABC transporter substrate-binding protein, partial [Armatimonadaceae bacterium]